MADSDKQRYKHQFPPAFSRLYADKDLSWVVPLRVDYIVGVIGFRFAGKSVALNYLSEKKGFRIYSLASAVRARADESGIPPTRPNLQDLGDDMRAETEDGSRLARLALRQIRLDQLEHNVVTPPVRIAVGGFKHPQELEAFERLTRFRAIRLHAPLPLRYERARRSGLLRRELSEISPTRTPSMKSFRGLIDGRDRHGAPGRSWASGYEQAVDAVMATATAPVDIRNAPVRRPTRSDADKDEDLISFYEQIDRAVERIERDLVGRASASLYAG
ncbi:MAG TPA: hypothetical protein VHF50_07830 [Solirubrobacterales bacterium]|nr:hypothetical protein [Solirubrobacterales bacterium]